MSLTLTPATAENAAWLLLLGGLFAGIGVETNWGQTWNWPLPRMEATPPSFAKPTLTAPYRLPQPDTFLETTLRPAFVSTRRPAPIPPPPEPPKPSMKQGQFLLTGTTIVPEGKFAYLFEKASNKTRVVAEGKEINGIKVKEVGADRVLLTQYDDTELLTLVSVKALPPPSGPAKPQAISAAGSAPPKSPP